MINFLKLKWLGILTGFFALLFGAGTALAANAVQVTVNPDSHAAGVSTNHAVSFVTSSTGAIEAGGAIKVYYPDGFNLSNVTLGGYSGILGNATLTKSGNMVTVTLGATSNVGNSSLVSFQLLGVINSQTPGDYSATLKTQSAGGITIDGPTGSMPFTITQTLDHFSVVPSTTNIMVGGNVTLTITAKDIANNTVTGYTGSPTLSGLATSPNSNVPYYGTISFTSGVASVTVRSYSTQAGQSVTVTDGTATGNSGLITFTQGNISSIGVTPSDNQTITAGGQVQFSAVSYDAYGNSRSGDTFTWTNATSTGLFNTTTAGAYQVQATSGGINSNPVSVTVNPGPAATITIDPASALNVLAGSSRTISATIKDQFANNVANGTVVNWTRTNTNFTLSGSTSITTNGLAQITLTAAALVGQTTTVRAQVGSVYGDSATINVIAAAVDHLVISPTNIHLANTDQSQTYTVTAYDQYANSWNVTSDSGTAYSTTDPKGSFTGSTFNAGQVGTWQIKATYGGKEVITQVIVDGTGTPASTTFSNPISQLDMGTVYKFSVKVYDADGNEIANPNLVWSVIFGTGAGMIDQTGAFIGTKAGTVIVKVVCGQVTKTIEFTVKVVEDSSSSDSSSSSSSSSSNSTSESSTDQEQKQEDQKTTDTSKETKTTPPQTTKKVTSENDNQESIEVIEEDEGEIKGTEIPTISSDETSSEKEEKSNYLLWVSLIVAALILAAAYWGYVYWGVEEKVTKVVSDQKTQTPKETKKVEVQDIEKINGSNEDEKSRW